MASIIKAWNPWWAEKIVPKEKIGIERTTCWMSCQGSWVQGK
ncbi:MAG: hypothetical protein ABIB71_04220 [Candidatus Woesearchaeota archaeon]